jgi:hypothetical protein
VNNIDAPADFGGGDDFGVALRAARLDDRDDARLERELWPIAEGELYPCW